MKEAEGRRSMASSFRVTGCFIVALALASGSVGIISPPAVAADIDINPNEDLLVKLPPRVATIVVGNPLMVDVHMAARDLMVITAKSYGETNIIILDRVGTVLMEKTILVSKKYDDELVVYSGIPNASVLHINGAKRVDLPLGN